MSNLLAAAALITAETLELSKGAFAQGQVPIAPGLQKSGINIAQALTGYNLEAPSKKLFPVYSPLRNRISRKAAPYGATATNWKAITAINSTKLWPGVPEATRNSFNTTATEEKNAAFKSFGHDDYVTFEALSASKGFEDIRATAALNLLYSVMISEEKEILGGNNVDLGVVANLVGTPSNGAGTLTPGATYKVQVSALVLRGYDRAEKAAAAAGANEADGESDVSGAATISVIMGGADDTITLTWDAKRGAVAYNVFVKLTGAGNAPYLATTTVNAYTVLTVGTGADANLTDLTGNDNEYDGMIKQIEANNGALFVSLDNDTLTSDSAGGITEFDAMLQTMWDTYKLGPTVILVNSQQSLDITKKIGSSSALAYRIMLSDGQKDVVGGMYVGGYLNKFASSFADGVPNVIPLKIHPNLPAGTILFVVEALPYPNNQIPNVWEVETRQEYTQYEWALNQRRYEFGIYGQEVLKGYFPAAQGAIVCVKPG